MAQFNETTKNAQKIAIVMYKHYKKMKEDSNYSGNALNWGTADTILETIGGKWSRDDVVSACWELKECEIIDGFRKKNELSGMRFTTKGIAVLEKIPQKRFDSILNRVAQVKSIL